MARGMVAEVSARVRALASTPVGPELAGLLASLDVSGLTDFECVEVLKARYRQANHERGELFGVVAEVVRRSNADRDVVLRQRCPNEFAADEVRAALVLTRSAAQGLCSLAEDLVVRLPAVQSALAAGVIDQARARILSDWTVSLSAPHARAVVAQVLAVAAKLTTAQLVKRVAALAMALDPEWVKREYRRAVRQRRVVGYRTREGTANLSGYDLPTDQVATACDRLDRLARAAKAAGHPGRLDHIRADVFLGLINGDYAGMSDAQIVQHLLTHSQPTTDSPTTDSSSTGGSDARDSDTGGSDTGGEPDDRGGPDPGEPDGPDGPGGGGPSGGGPSDAGPAAAVVGSQVSIEDRGTDAAGSSSGRLRLLVRLATLAGVDRRPGELVGWGPVHAELAHTMALTPSAAWWYVLVDQAGAPVSIGSIRRRPPGHTATATATASANATATDHAGAGGGRGWQVWVQVTQAMLDTLADRPPPGWGAVIAEIRVKAQRARGAPNDDPAARLPGRALRRWIRVRDRTCVFPGCGMPAPRTDADHTIEHATGGPTTDTNLASTCRHDHRLRHEGKWRVHRARTGQIVWTSRFGHQYQRLPPPSLDDLPEPISTAAGIQRGIDDLDRDQSTVDDSPHTCLTEPPPQPEPPPPEPPPPQPPPSPAEDDIPPF